MNKQLRSQLEVLYGEYLYLYEKEYDYLIKKFYKEKIEALEVMFKEKPYDN